MVTDLFRSHRVQLASKNFTPKTLPSVAALAGLGAVAQLGERLICTQEVAGSIPTSSTSNVSDQVTGL